MTAVDYQSGIPRYIQIADLIRRELKGEGERIPSEHELCARATDATGDTQPLDAADVWNVGGYGVNAVQRVPVRVA